VSFFSKWLSKPITPAPEKNIHDIQHFIKHNILNDPEIKLYLLQIDMIFAERRVDPKRILQADEESVYDIVLDDRIQALMMKIKERGVEMTSPEEWLMMTNVIQKSKIDIWEIYKLDDSDEEKEKEEEEQVAREASA
jgi:hypothetical protein